MGAPYTTHGFSGTTKLQMKSEAVRYCWTLDQPRFTGSCTRKKSFTVTVPDSAHRFRSCLA